MINSLRALTTLSITVLLLASCNKNPVDSVARTGQVVFVSSDDRKLYTQNLDGSNRKRIYLNNIEDNINRDPWSQWLEDSTFFFNLSQPRWSPDGAKLALVVGSYEQSELIVLDLAAGGGKVVSSNFFDVGSPDWSPDGSKITYIMSTYYWSTFTEVFVTDLTTESVYQITRLSDQVGNLGSPRWSDDGEKIFFTHSAHPDSLRNIYVYSFESDTVEIIGAWPAISAFARDGNRVFGYNDGNIFSYCIIDKQEKILTSGPNDQDPRLIDSDMQLIFTRVNSIHNYSVWLMTSDGKDIHKVENSEEFFNANSTDIFWK